MEIQFCEGKSNFRIENPILELRMQRIAGEQTGGMSLAGSRAKGSPPRRGENGDRLGGGGPACQCTDLGREVAAPSGQLAERIRVVVSPSHGDPGVHKAVVGLGYLDPSPWSSWLGRNS